MATPSSALAPFVRQRAVLLTTYRKDVRPVGTAVSIAFEGDRAFVRTFDSAGKLKRIRHNPEVEIAPSTMRGRPTGPAIRIHARILDGEEVIAASRALAWKYPSMHGVAVPLFHRIRLNRTMHIELRPVDR
jgi:PPOX class probable F420-dependent enzyme